MGNLQKNYFSYLALFKVSIYVDRQRTIWSGRYCYKSNLTHCFTLIKQQSTNIFWATFWAMLSVFSKLGQNQTSFCRPHWGSILRYKVA